MKLKLSGDIIVVLKSIAKWWHHVTNPHCDICSDELHEARQCNNCETLRALLDAEKFEKKELLNHLLGVNKVSAPINSIELPQPVAPNHVSWRVRREMLEAEDRAAAKTLRDRQNELREQVKSTEELERELLG